MTSNITPPITIETEDGKQTYVTSKSGGVEIYDESGRLVMYLTRSPEWVRPLLKVLADRCPDLISKRDYE